MVRNCVLGFVVTICWLVGNTNAQNADPQRTDTVTAGKTIVRLPWSHANSTSVRALAIDRLGVRDLDVPEPKPLPLRTKNSKITAADQADMEAQTGSAASLAASVGVNFDGIGAQGYSPSDVNLAVGPNHIVQTVNVRMAVYSKTGVLLSGPTNLADLYKPLGGSCTMGGSDPIVLYDRLADRWLITSIGISAVSTFAECVAISKTSDPTGRYTLYGYDFGYYLNDYPKIGVWPTPTNSAYMATYNMFAGGSYFAGVEICAFDRAKLLAGAAAPAQLCQLTPETEGGYLPADLDGWVPPTSGAPGLFVAWVNNNPGQLYLRKLTPDFKAATAKLSPATTITVANSALACGNAGACVPQLESAQPLDTLGDRLMYRMGYRKFAQQDHVILNHSVNSSGHVGVRWYDLVNLNGAVKVNQQGTFAPDSTFRWMASAAMDQTGDIALGYSASNSAIHPAIRFTGRLPTDPPGKLENEATLVQGTGSQLAYVSRWGDYTAMQIDPVDDCTFWYTNQYVKTNGVFNWSSYIGTISFSNCTSKLGAAAVTLTPASLQWSSPVKVGTTSGAKTVTLTNTGIGTLLINGITTAGDFAKKSTTCQSALPAGGSCVISVVFTPRKTGLRIGRLTFKDNAAKNPQGLSLSGTGQ